MKGEINMAKIDCSITKNYFKEKKRLTKGCSIDCNLCVLGSRNNSTGYTCGKFEQEFPEQAIDKIQKWSDEHPEKTMLKDLLEKYPNLLLVDNKNPYMCPYHLGYEEYPHCGDFADCLACWSRPIEKN